MLTVSKNNVLSDVFTVTTAAGTSLVGLACLSVQLFIQKPPKNFFFFFRKAKKNLGPEDIWTGGHKVKDLFED